jgi:hypothetical protein
VYRSRPVVLVIFAAAAAACSTRDDSADIAGLAHDSTLARLSVNPQGTEPLPAACGTVAVATHPSAPNESEAKALARQAYDAELLGRVQDARALLSRASALDGTDEAVAYHLGRTSEALGDRAGAKAAYCRYLSLTSTAAGSDVRQRLAELSHPQASLALGSGKSAAPPRARAAAATRVVSRVGSPAAPRVIATSTTAPSSSAPPTQTVDMGASARSDEKGGDYHSASDGDVVATSTTLPPRTQPATAPSSRRRGPSRVQGAGVGAVAGAIVGAVAGHSVKSAVIGAAAGGILGTVVAGASR